ncbi:thermonuclease family protein [Candidatus Magnetobacterium casense]|uniref:Thermonuclease family protein n=1 Tax=Candidatus Magnetobacterium casense TaxID=1455061 RepID=A0ABS6RVW3_9BACT|nr:thermonuclease family protein [Candidatus Magnetobacterium casensis]MBV6340164.1 thermonuclease family protein [Candidatus Magnetobacterium casensis]
MAKNSKTTMGSIFLFVLLSFASTGYTVEYHNEGKVVKVKDGDTVAIQPILGGEFYTCRLYGIDAPEKNQEGGEEATEALKQFILGKDVDVKLTGGKTYGREVCIITYNGKDINQQMIESGYAWAYIHYLKGQQEQSYVDAERRAKTAKIGLWQSGNAEAPWEFRHKGKAVSSSSENAVKPHTRQVQPTSTSEHSLNPSSVQYYDYSNTNTNTGVVNVKGYYRKDGTYVKPHTRRSPRRH